MQFRWYCAAARATDNLFKGMFTYQKKKKELEKKWRNTY